MATATVIPNSRPAAAAKLSSNAAQNVHDVPTLTPKQQAQIGTMAASKVKAAAPVVKPAKGAATGYVPPANLTPEQEAAAQAQAETAGQIAPLQGQITTAQTQGNQQQQTIGAEYGQILPTVMTAANNEAKYNQETNVNSQAIFAQAGQQLNVLNQNAAAQAQQLAQQTGGPVSTGQFTAATDPYAAAEVAQGAVGQLTTGALGDVNTAAANSFAGKVFPAMELEDRATSRNAVTAEINGLKTQIATIQGTTNKLADAKLPALLAAQRTYDLDQAQLKANRLKANRDWETTKASLALQDRKLADAEQAQVFTENLNTTKVGMSQQQLDLEVQKMTDQEKQAAAKLNLSNQEYILRANQYAASNKIATQRLQVQEDGNARSIIDAALGGSSSNKPVTQTVKKILSPSDPLAQAAASYTGLGKPPANVYWDPNSKQWYTYQKLEMTPAQWAQRTGASATGTTDPNALYQLLTSALPQASTALKVNLIKVRLGLSPNWKPGQPAKFDAKSLKNLTKQQLADEAAMKGFKAAGNIADVARQRLTDFLLSTNPK